MSDAIDREDGLSVAILGLGYVGAVTAGCLARLGRVVFGVEVDPVKLEAVRAGRSPVSEPGLDELLAEGVRAGRIGIAELGEAVRRADVVMVSVGTPTASSGVMDLAAVERACTEIGAALPIDGRFRAIVVRSTVLPGTIDELVRPSLARSAPDGAQYGIAVNPEFLREGSGIRDFFEASRTIIGADDARTGALVEAAFTGLSAPVFQVSIRTAELAKYADNAFHALKIAYANEIASFARASDIDGREVMRLLAADDRLNVSAAYLRPGFAFGGSCLPKDLRALAARARTIGLPLPLIEAALTSNAAHLERAIGLVEGFGRRPVALLGLSFKAATDDLRESPAVALAEALLQRGYPLAIFDEDVLPDQLRGANRRFIDEHLPHLGRLLAASLESALEGSGIVVISKWFSAVERLDGLLRDDQVLVDLVGLPIAAALPRARYAGIGWP
ncbi:MAG: nucleotide sugar dehydrogenase [Candidatus Limnocylindrales bacterium]